MHDKIAFTCIIGKTINTYGKHMKLDRAIIVSTTMRTLNVTYITWLQLEIKLFILLQARSNYNAGNYQQAVASATTARNASYISIFCGIGIYILIIILSSA